MPCGTARLCGISTCFQVLSPSTGQVAHALLTRPPLARRRRGRGPCRTPRPFDLHVLGTPPAFILSQDQTLMFISFLQPGMLLASSFPCSVRSHPSCSLLQALLFLVLVLSEFPSCLFRLPSDGLLLLKDFQGCIAVHLPRFKPFYHVLFFFAKKRLNHFMSVWRRDFL